MLDHFSTHLAINWQSVYLTGVVIFAVVLGAQIERQTRGKAQDVDRPADVLLSAVLWPVMLLVIVGFVSGALWGRFRK